VNELTKTRTPLEKQLFSGKKKARFKKGGFQGGQLEEVERQG
jgi:hypothetical protein